MFEQGLFGRQRKVEGRTTSFGQGQKALDGVVEVEKANPYHDERGRFTTKDQANFMSLWGKPKDGGPSSEPETPGFGAEFSRMPTGPASSKEAKAWVKSMQEKYDKDPDFRAVADSITLITQGEYKVFKEFTAVANGGSFSPDVQGSMIPKWADIPFTGNPMGKYKGYFKGQGLDADAPADRKTYMQAAKLINKTLETSPALGHSLYRGLVGKWAIKALEHLKDGDIFDVPGITSFTTDRDMARAFSEGNAKGQHKTKRGIGHGVLIEIAPGAKGIPASALSPWDQKEILSSGKFKIQRVSRTNEGGLDRMHIVLEPLGPLKKSDPQSLSTTQVLFDLPFLQMDTPSPVKGTTWPAYPEVD